MKVSQPKMHVGLVETEWGWVALGWTERGLCYLDLPTSFEKAEEELRTGFLSVEWMAVPREYAFPIRRYFQGQPVNFDFAVDYLGRTGFFPAVWDAARLIPYGTVVTYGQLAAMVGRATAARAVGSAMAANPLPIVVPCHRVVAAGGRLGAYSGGLDWKLRLLKHEGAL